MASTGLRRAQPDDAAAILAVVQEGFETYVEFAPAGWRAPDQS